ncbi:MAG: helix-turn-helix transcriptional regulator [Firmicutes bacterium]|nr:helix-turn-helix transcriptional regulator [Bacillota bacterium]
MGNELGRKMRLLRQSRGLTQQEVGYRTGISIPHISSLERGERHPSLEYAMRIAEALGVTIGMLCESNAITSLPDDTGYSSGPLPGYLKSFVLREGAHPYVAMAHRVSSLDASDYQVLSTMVDIMAQRKRLRGTMSELE